MKKIAFLFSILIIATASAQNITGQWNGLLKEINLRLVVHISKTDTGYTATLDSPDQGAKGIPVTNTSFENDTLTIMVANLGVNYTAQLVDENFEGTFYPRRNGITTKTNPRSH